MIAEFMFVAVTCIGQQCGFMVSNYALSESRCNQIKKEFLALPFKSEVTLAATQCVKITEKETL